MYQCSEWWLQMWSTLHPYRRSRRSWHHSSHYSMLRHLVPVLCRACTLVRGHCIWLPLEDVLDLCPSKTIPNHWDRLWTGIQRFLLCLLSLRRLCSRGRRFHRNLPQAVFVHTPTWASLHWSMATSQLLPAPHRFWGTRHTSACLESTRNDHHSRMPHCLSAHHSSISHYQPELLYIVPTLCLPLCRQSQPQHGSWPHQDRRTDVLKCTAWYCRRHRAWCFVCNISQQSSWKFLLAGCAHQAIASPSSIESTHRSPRPSSCNRHRSGQLLRQPLESA